MADASIQRRSLTPEGYIAWEESQVERHEFVNGEIRAMSGGSIAHNAIVNNIAGEVRSRLKGTPCRSFTSTQRIQATTSTSVFYPDIVIVCNVPKVGLPNSILNPITVFEVLSPSTSQYDRTLKFKGYQEIQSLQEYIIVHQDRALAEVYHRAEDGVWDTIAYAVYVGLGAMLVIESAGISIPLHEIYEYVSVEEIGNNPVDEENAKT